MQQNILNMEISSIQCKIQLFLTFSLLHLQNKLYSAALCLILISFLEILSPTWFIFFPTAGLSIMRAPPPCLRLFQFALLPDVLRAHGVCGWGIPRRTLQANRWRAAEPFVTTMTWWWCHLGAHMDTSCQSWQPAEKTECLAQGVEWWRFSMAPT